MRIGSGSERKERTRLLSDIVNLLIPTGPSVDTTGRGPREGKAGDMREKFLKHLRKQIEVQCSVFSWSLRIGVLTERVAVERIGLLCRIIGTGFSLDMLEYEEFMAFRSFVDNLGNELAQEIQDLRRGD